jgi:hypothetical protein
MKKVIFLIFTSITFFYYSCSEPITPDNGAPTPPLWLDLSVKIDSLPSVNKTGSIKSTFVVKGLGDKMPVFYDSLQNTNDTLNYIRISFKPVGGERFTIMTGDTTWEGKVSYLDTIVLNTQFKPLQTPYWTLADGGYREFNWWVDFLIGFYYKNENGNLIVFWGNLNPSLSNPKYATLFVNTNSGDTFLKIYAQK